MALRYGAINSAKKPKKYKPNFCKYYTGLKQNTNDSFALGECGRFPMAIFYMTQVIKYWLKLTQMLTIDILDSVI